MNQNQVRATIVAVLILLPVALYFFLKSSSRAVYNTMPYQYSVSQETGDTLWHQIPDFQLEGPGPGELLTQADLAGKVSIIGFFDQKDELVRGGPKAPRPFPIMIDNLKKVYIQVKDVPSIQFVLVNTALNRDSLPQIQDLPDSLDLPRDKFLFVNASREELFKLGLETFRMPAFQGHQRDSLPFTSQMMALVDKAGKVRRYYLGTKKYDMEKVLLDDLRALYALEYRDEFTYPE